jgi:hypothetical protein
VFVLARALSIRLSSLLPARSTRSLSDPCACVGWLAGWLACWLQMLNEMQLGKLRKAAKLAAMLADPDALDMVDKEDAGASSVCLST